MVFGSVLLCFVCSFEEFSVFFLFVSFSLVVFFVFVFFSIEIVIQMCSS